MCVGVDVEAPYISGRRLQKSGNFPAILFWPACASGYMDGVRYYLRDVVEDMLGGDVKQLNNQWYYRLAGDGDAFAWHQDIMFRRDHSIGVGDYLQTVIAIDEPRGGHIRFIEGSHRLGELGLVDKGDLRKAPGGAPVEGLLRWPVPKPGDLLMWDAYTVHGSFPNDSGYSRMNYMNGFCRADRVEEWPWYLENGDIVDLMPEDIPYGR